MHILWTINKMPSDCLVTLQTDTHTPKNKKNKKLVMVFVPGRGDQRTRSGGGRETLVT